MVAFLGGMFTGCVIGAGLLHLWICWSVDRDDWDRGYYDA